MNLRSLGLFCVLVLLSCAASSPLSVVHAGAAEATVRLEPRDTSLNINNTNYSTDPILRTYTWPDKTVANAILLKFDLSSLPPGAVVHEATLFVALLTADSTLDLDYTVAAHKLVTKNPVVEAATGYTADGVTGWTANGCCHNGIPLAQADISPPEDTKAIDKLPGYKSWSVTTMVQEWLAEPATNFGLLLNSDPSKPRDHFRYFASMENPVATLRPYLQVSYSLPVVDTTPPAVEITAPVNGASAANTIAVAANAADDLGVAGVQFQLDGVNLGAEDTTAPYSVSWNTTDVSDGSHTLTAVARDGAGNQMTSGDVTVTVSNAGPPPDGLAALYPGDVGIEAHPDVVFTERFEDSLTNIFGRWTDILNGAAMSTTSDVPPGSPGTGSLTITFGASDGGHLYKQLTPGIDDTLYVRYYIKYPTTGTYIHTGIWMGGNNPASPWPNPQAGSKPAGNDRFIASAEQNIGSGTGLFDHYNYWMNMRLSNDGNYWGNLLLNDPNVRAQTGQWMCVEHMVKLNNPTTASNGEHAIWLDGVKVSHLGQGFPNGSWDGGIFTQNPTGSPFEGFRWRSDAKLNLNWIWLLVYAPGSAASNMKFDHVVVAKSYVGCLASSGPADTTAPTVSISSPSAGTTQSGTVTVTANASDNVAVAGVQFKLDGANLGAEDTAAPYSISWDTAAATNGSHTFTAVARDAAGNTQTSAGVAITVSNGASAAWPNEPSGFTVLSDFHLGTAVPATNQGDPLGGGWKVWRNTAGRGSLALDSTAPQSPQGVFQVQYPIGFPSGQTPTMLEYAFQPRPTELYWAFWWKPSNPFQSDSSGVNKIAFIWTPSGNTDLLYFDLSPNPWRIRAMDDLFAGGGPRAGLRDEPNVNTTVITLGQWYRIEIYVKYSTGSNADGILKWWVNGVLNGHYTNLKMVQDGGFSYLQLAPTYGGNTGDTKEQNDYYWYDHVRVSRR